MSDATHSAEQQQLLVEIEAVTKNLGQHAGANSASYEAEQGRKLIEKAVSLGLPEQSYADLERHIASHDSEASRS